MRVTAVSQAKQTRFVMLVSPGVMKKYARWRTVLKPSPLTRRSLVTAKKLRDEQREPVFFMVGEIGRSVTAGTADDSGHKNPCHPLKCLKYLCFPVLVTAMTALIIK